MIKAGLLRIPAAVMALDAVGHARRNVDPVSFNRAVWDHQISTGNERTRPVSPALIAANRTPCADLADMGARDLAEYQARNDPMEFSYTLADLIGGLIDAGFVLRGLFEDDCPVDHDPISAFIKGFIATIATKP